MKPVIGCETEYAISPLPRASSERAWGPEGLLEQVVSAGQRLGRGSLPAVRGAGSRSGFFLRNGSRLYRDGSHVEYASPETTSPWDLVTHILAGERLVSGGLERVREAERLGQAIQLYKTSQSYGACPSHFGCHENHGYRHAPQGMMPMVACFLASRIIFTGSGGYVARRSIRFSLSPRLHVLSQSVSGDDGYYMINGRNEHLSDGRTRRLHLISGESLCSHLGMLLKAGTTALVVAMADHGVKLPARYRLAKTMASAIAFAGDPTCKACAPVESRGRSIGALGLQRWYLGRAEAHLGADWMPGWAPRIIVLWREVLNLLEDGAPCSVATRLDWAMKWALHEAQCEKAGFDPTDLPGWDNDIAKMAELAVMNPYQVDRENAPLLMKLPAVIDRVLNPWPLFEERDAKWDRVDELLHLRAQLHEIDTRFAEVSGRGLFNQMDAAGVLEHRVEGIGEQQINDAMTTPPSDTRAHLRGELIDRLCASGKKRRYHADWHYIRCADRAQVDLPDPLERAMRWRKLKPLSELRPRPERRVPRLRPDMPCITQEQGARVAKLYQSGRFYEAFAQSVRLLRPWKRGPNDYPGARTHSFPVQRVYRHLVLTTARLGVFDPPRMLAQLFPGSPPNRDVVGDYLFVYRMYTLAPLPEMGRWVRRVDYNDGWLFPMGYLTNDLAEAIGYWHLQRGAYDSARAVLEPIAKISEQLRGTRARDNLFNLYLRTGDLRRARTMLYSLKHHARNIPALLADHVLPAEAKFIGPGPTRDQLLHKALSIHRKNKHRLGMARVLLMQARCCGDGPLAAKLRASAERQQRNVPSLERCPLFRRIQQDWERWSTDTAPDEHGDFWWGL